MLPYAALVLAAFRGHEAEAAGLDREHHQGGHAGGQGTAVQEAQWATAVVANAAGRYEDALEAARPASEADPELVVSAWALSELVEAAARSGKTQLAADALERLVEHRTDNSDGGWGRGLEARCTGAAERGRRGRAPLS